MTPPVPSQNITFLHYFEYIRLKVQIMNFLINAATLDCEISFILPSTVYLISLSPDIILSSYGQTFTSNICDWIASNLHDFSETAENWCATYCHKIIVVILWGCMRRSVFSELGLRKTTQSCGTVEGVDLLKRKMECCTYIILMALRILEISLVLMFIDKRISLVPAKLINTTCVTLQWHKLFIVTFYYTSSRNVLQMKFLYLSFVILSTVYYILIFFEKKS